RRRARPKRTFRRTESQNRTVRTDGCVTCDRPVATLCCHPVARWGRPLGARSDRSRNKLRTRPFDPMQTFGSDPMNGADAPVATVPETSRELVSSTHSGPPADDPTRSPNAARRRSGLIISRALPGRTVAHRQRATEAKSALPAWPEQSNHLAPQLPPVLAGMRWPKGPVLGHGVGWD